MARTTDSRSSDALIRRVHTLTPALRAYALGYITSTAPRLPAIINVILRSNVPIHQKLEALRSALTGAVGTNKLPTSCAVIVGGSTIIPKLLGHSLLLVRGLLPSSRLLVDAVLQRAVLLCTFASAWLAFNLLNKDENWRRKRAKSRAAQLDFRSTHDSPNQHHLPPPRYDVTYAGKTIDFTLFALCRAIEILVITAWTRSRSQRLHPKRVVPTLSGTAAKLADPLVFSTSAAIIMWSWFYAPERLPKIYGQWISKIAEIDRRLIHALRLCRQGDLVYGSSATQDADLPSLCRELKLPAVWGNPAVTIPIPCELYHCGSGKSCEAHAATRFMRTFKVAIRLYLPLQLVGLLRRPSLDRKRVITLLKDATRSSSFLAAFVAFFYYSVCLARTRLGPNLFNRTTVTPQMWDSGLCVLAGCLACGWSILLEKGSRRQEIAFFVAPRALGTLFPRVYDQQHQKREQLVFATSVAIVMNAASRESSQIRGVFGRILQQVLRPQ